MAINGTHINDILKDAVNKQASDIHIKVGLPPILRINRELQYTKFPEVTEKESEDFLNQIASGEQKNRFIQDLELDISYNAQSIGRFRVNVYVELGYISMVFRWVRTAINSFKELGLPDICEELSLKHDGLIILTGPTGCGKSTTLAAMIDYMNKHVKRKIITIEDPVEFLHESEKSIISQREVGPDTHSFADALKRVLRQDPNVILIGEMRDLESMSIALTAAETGHLILTTLHTPSAYGAIDRIVDSFPPHQHDQIRLQLSMTLQAIVYQVLLPTANGEGVVPAVEVLIATPAIRNLIRESKTYQALNYMQSGKSLGMQTLDQAIKDLVWSKKVSNADALSHLRSHENDDQAEGFRQKSE